MARKEESGLKYFPVNSDIIHNTKVKLVVAEFGPKAWAVILPLYCRIYREKGYWIDWYDEDGKLLFAQDECRLDVPFVNEVVAGCVRRGLFNKTVFDLFGVLTSDRIQENYFEGKSRSKHIVFVSEFLIENENVNINQENVNIIDLDVSILSKKVDISTQNKRDKNKLKEKREDVTIPFDSEIFIKEWEGWKKYKSSQHKFIYKSPQTEKAALSELFKISDGIEAQAIEIINRSIANGWQGLFQLKQNGKNNSTSNGTCTTQKVISGGGFGKL